ncbi:hypothetical protein V8C86DRAFT_1382858 [Haematococcus lacustris]
MFPQVRLFVATFILFNLLDACQGSCLESAASDSLWQLTARSRPFPTVEWPVTSDWPRTRPITERPKWPGCTENTLMYKVYKGVLYANHNHFTGVSQWQRDNFVEMMLVALWLYKDFPDCDLWLNFSDSPQFCAVPVPFLQYQAIRGVRRSNLPRNTSLHLTHLLSPSDVSKLYENGRDGHEQQQLVPVARGFTIPYPDDWERLSLSEQQLLNFTQCLVRHHASSSKATAAQEQTANGSWASYHITKAVWRGSSTGMMRGWSPRTSTKEASVSHEAAKSLFNKRTYMAVMSRPYPWLDIGLTGYYWDPNHLKAVATLNHMDMEEVSRYMMSISIDGNGTPWRFPRQLLSMTAVAKVDSALKEWFAHLLQPGVHYVPIKHDLRDLASRTHDLIMEAQHDSSRLERMADAARDAAVKHMNGVAQLDALMAAIAHSKQVCQWEVQAPGDASQPGEPNWQLIKLKRDKHWHGRGFRHLRENIMAELRQHFE